MKRFGKTMMVLGAGALFGASTAHAGVTFPYDPDGTGPLLSTGVDLAALDWDPGNAVAVFDRDLGSTGALRPGDLLTTYYQAKLQAFKQQNGNPQTIFTTGGGTLGALNYGLADLMVPGIGAIDFEWTAVAKFRERVTSVNAITGEIKLEVVSDPVNYFKVFYDNNTLTRANDLAGTGFDDGTLILQSGGGMGAGNFDPSADPQGDPPAVVIMDQFNGVSVPWNTPDPFDPDQTGGYHTVDGQGSFAVDSDISFYDINFLDLSALVLQQGTFSITSTDSTQSLPFDSVNPSIQFFDMALNGGAGGFFNPKLGIINAGVFAPGDDALQFEADANTSFEIRSANVPEPATAALGLMGLLGLALGGRRSRKA